jgi:hypothetical protein
VNPRELAGDDLQLVAALLLVAPGHQVVIPDAVLYKTHRSRIAVWYDPTKREHVVRAYLPGEKSNMPEGALAQMPQQLDTGHNPDAELLTPAAAAAMLKVAVRTLARQADGGLLRVARTAGGHRRYYLADIQTLLSAGLPDLPDEAS